MAARSFLVLLLALTGCSASLVLKQPVADQCRSQGLSGCDELTDGVLAYVDGDTEKGRDRLIAGAAQNSPGQVKKFAAALRSLQDLPGMREQMGPLNDVVAILSGDAAAIAGDGEASGAVRPAQVDLGDAASAPKRGKLFAETTATDDTRKRGCKDAGDAQCVLAHAGGIVVTDIVFDGTCEGAFAGAFPRDVWATSSARWVLRRQVGAGSWNVEADEVFVVGASTGARCDVSWAARPR